MCDLIQPFLESYWITCSYLLIQNSKVSLKLSTLQQRILNFGLNLFDESKIFYYEACNQESIGNCVELLVKNQLLRSDAQT